MRAIVEALHAAEHRVGLASPAVRHLERGEALQGERLERFEESRLRGSVRGPGAEVAECPHEQGRHLHDPEPFPHRAARQLVGRVERMLTASVEVGAKRRGALGFERLFAVAHPISPR